MRPCRSHFLGGATTVTGSQYLLVTERAKVLIDCGMFQGSPNESIRNRVPFAFDPAELDAVLLTHAHLDHCGLLPLLVKGGYRGADPRHRRHDRARDARPARLRQAPRGVRQARGALGEAPSRRGRGRRPARGRRVPGGCRPGRRGRVGDGRGRRHERHHDAPPPPRTSPPRRPATRKPSTSPRPIEAVREPGDPPTAWPRDPEAELRAQPPHLEVDLDAPLYTAKDAEALAGAVQGPALRRRGRGRARHPRHVRGRRAHPGLGDHPAPRPGDRGRGGAVDRLLRRPRPAGHADPARPDRR